MDTVEKLFKIQKDVLRTILNHDLFDIKASWAFDRSSFMITYASKNSPVGYMVKIHTSAHTGGVRCFFAVMNCKSIEVEDIYDIYCLIEKSATLSEENMCAELKSFNILEGLDSE